jgi:hypothetical protein
MPKTGRKSLTTANDERLRAANKRRTRRFQDRLHKAVRQQREALRDQFPGRRPPEWIARHHAIRKIMTDERRQAADD